MRFVLVTTIAVLLLSSQALADTDPIVYHSPGDDGAPPVGVPLYAPGSTVILHLYMGERDGSSQASTTAPCESGDGNERCGWDLEIGADGAVDFLGFAGSGDVVWGLRTGTEPRLRLNGGAPDTGQLGAVKLGDLEITAPGPGGVRLLGGTAVDAALRKVELEASEIVTVPEPGGGAFGLAALLGMRFLARRRTSTRSPARRG